MKTSHLKIFGIALIAILAGGGAMLALEPDLTKIHNDIADDYERVSHIDADAFTQMPAGDVVIFDVREPEEYAVSHLPGAILLDPNLSEEDFQSRYANILSGKTAVFYCSVGRRSSNLAQRVASTVEAQTSHAPVNLTGGLFQWSNDKRSLVTTEGSETDAIHPYNAHWGRLIKNREAIQYTPAPETFAPAGSDD
ncbi:MAG: rhodanese-like domain-containing protein [Pseudomonadota bacterium]